MIVYKKKAKVNLYNYYDFASNWYWFLKNDEKQYMLKKIKYTGKIHAGLHGFDKNERDAIIHYYVKNVIELI